MKRAVFLFNLVQDVNILRPLAYLTARETGAALQFLVSAGFRSRDAAGLWQAEIDALARDVGAGIETFDSPAAVRAALQGGTGLLLSASESHLEEHRETRDAFRVAPPGYLKITLQHGLECVGFLQNRAHDLRHGRDVRFGADVVCGWLAPHRLTAMPVSERSKLHVTGPPTLLHRPPAAARPDPGGLVCENLQSVRLTAGGDRRGAFLENFFAFGRYLEARGEGLTLRPHPGGIFARGAGPALPGNVAREERPVYRLDLAAYRYGISAPSTMVLDLVLAGIPVAVWQDPEGTLDLANYDGLTRIRRPEDWPAFARDAGLRPDAILARQRRFLDRLEMPRDPAEIYRRFARLIVNGLARGNQSLGGLSPGGQP